MNAIEKGVLPIIGDVVEVRIDDKPSSLTDLIRTLAFFSCARISKTSSRPDSQTRIMAEAVAMSAMYLRLGFSVSTALVLLVYQGMENLDELELLDDTEVEVLCKLVRRPGGHTVNPNAAGAGQPEFIPA